MRMTVGSAIESRGSLVPSLEPVLRMDSYGAGGRDEPVEPLPGQTRRGEGCLTSTKQRSSWL